MSILHIRPATREDIPLILTFICELAAYENLRHEVVATEAILDENLFGENRRGAEVIIAEAAGEPAGFALFFHNFSTFLGKAGVYLEDLYVRPKFRGQGYGEALLRHLAQIAKARNCGRLEWWVLDWNEAAIGFYKKMGAISMDEWTVFRVTGTALDQLADGEKV